MYTSISPRLDASWGGDREEGRVPFAGDTEGADLCSEHCGEQVWGGVGGRVGAGRGEGVDLGSLGSLWLLVIENKTHFSS